MSFCRWQLWLERRDFGRKRGGQFELQKGTSVNHLRAVVEAGSRLLRGIYCTLVEQKMDYLYHLQPPMTSSCQCSFDPWEVKEVRWYHIGALRRTMIIAWLDALSSCKIQLSSRRASFEDPPLKYDE
ncbi:hypothetical protein TNCT_509781 [Trichonephila clavata]|uniref:Uncharacterized protein n=1 Tax=Trichonephila clavata TaxID=2740835 RepID=A0A8X6HA13_TRICU|nr:hypothetical protein TNCT_509781 [Trichonephila clavata]